MASDPLIIIRQHNLRMFDAPTVVRTGPRLRLIYIQYPVITRVPDGMNSHLKPVFIGLVREDLDFGRRYAFRRTGRQGGVRIRRIQQRRA